MHSLSLSCYSTAARRPRMIMTFVSQTPRNMQCNAPYNETAPFVCAFAFVTRLLMKSKKANWLALAPNSYTNLDARYEPKMARR